MRVISGIYKHRKLLDTKLITTRETQDRIKESMFNLLNINFKNLIVLDLFCGSAQLAIEAYSRGSKFIYINDINNKALDVAKKNLDSLLIKDYKIFNLDYLNLVNKLDTYFDLVFLDPPYDFNMYDDLLTKLTKILNNNAYIVLEMHKDKEINVLNYDIKKQRVYGYKKIIILNYKG